MEKWYFNNKNKRKTIYRDYSIGDTFEYRGTNVTIKNCVLYRLSEFQKKYELEEFEKPDDGMNDKNSIILVIEYEVEKIKEDGKGPDWDSAYIYTTETNNPTDYEIDMMLAGDRIAVSNMEVGENQSISVGTYFYKSNFLCETWENIDNTDFYIYMPDYEGSEYVRRVKIR